MKSTYDTSNLAQIPGAEVAILQSEWYSEYSDVMVNHCRQLLEKAQVSQIHHHVLPGTLELPFAARQVARTHKNLDAIIVFGIVVRGETKHFDMIVDMISRGFERVMFEEDIPLIIEVLPVENIEQAKSRCADDESNKGREAAICCAKMIAWRAGL